MPIARVVACKRPRTNQPEPVLAVCLACTAMCSDTADVLFAAGTNATQEEICEFTLISEAGKKNSCETPSPSLQVCTHCNAARGHAYRPRRRLQHQPHYTSVRRLVAGVGGSHTCTQRHFFDHHGSAVMQHSASPCMHHHSNSAHSHNHTACLCNQLNPHAPVDRSCCRHSALDLRLSTSPWALSVGQLRLR